MTTSKTKLKNFIVICTAILSMTLIAILVCGCDLIKVENQPQENKLPLEYKTQISEKYCSTGPTFYFNYNDNWNAKQTSMSVSSGNFNEIVELTNKNNSQIISFEYTTDMGGGTSEIKSYEVLKKCENFKGEEMTVSNTMMNDSIKNSNNYPYNHAYKTASEIELCVTKTVSSRDTLYCVQDSINAEKQLKNQNQKISRSDFHYYGNIGFRCYVTGTTLTAEEEQEIVDIMASLRSEKTTITPESYNNLIVGNYNLASPSSSLRMWLTLNSDGTATIKETSGAEHYETSVYNCTYKVTNTSQTQPNSAAGEYVEITLTPTDGSKPFVYTYIVSGDYIIDQPASKVDATQMKYAKQGYRFNRDK